MHVNDGMESKSNTPAKSLEADLYAELHQMIYGQCHIIHLDRLNNSIIKTGAYHRWQQPR